MRRLSISVGLALAVGVLFAGSVLANVGGSDLPLKGHLSGTSVHSYITGRLDAVSTGEVTHFGLATFEQHAQVAIIPGTPPTLDLTGTWTLTAANGDRIWGTLAGTGTPTDATHITLVVDYATTGGSGRFEGSSASFTATIYHHQVSLVSGVSNGEHVGSIDGELSW